LFGHEKGAFTGATARRRGKFVRADGGTLFLDEVGEISLGLQAKLLRALESGEIEPVGSEREVRVDVRVLAATNRDLDEAVAAGEFRKDLYYRLQVVTLSAPPLRERLGDVPALANRFLQQVLVEHKLPTRRLSDNALQRLATHTYPGNVRELRNLIERLAILSAGDTIRVADVSAQLSPPGTARGSVPALRGTLRETMSALERELLLQTLERHGWKMSEAARELGLERSHLYKKLKTHEIEKPVS
jgi:DNA-binding NtrC family response regulator